MSPLRQRAPVPGIAHLARVGLILAASGLSLARAPVGVHGAAASTRPELPRTHVDTAYVAPSGRTIAVPAGGDLQAALNGANPGDVITLAAGATFTGPFVLSNKPGAGWVIVRTGAPDGALPPSGARINPSYAGVLPKILAPGRPAIQTAPGAHHYRFIGIEFAPTPGQRNATELTLIKLGNAETSVQTLPNNIIFDRCYIHGDPSAGARRGIEMDSASTAVIDSYLSDFKLTGSEALPIQGHNGPGPFKIVNNYLEGAGENVMFGGADPSMHGLVPSDIEIRRNHFAKPLAWKIGNPEYAGIHWTVKNLFELKNARRVLVEGNLFEHYTAFQTSNIIAAEGAPNTGFVYRDNIAPHNSYGVIGTDFGVGLSTLTQYFPQAVFEYNVLAGQPTYSTLYPPRNFFPATLGDVGFSDLAAGDYRLAPSRPYTRRAST